MAQPCVRESSGVCPAAGEARKRQDNWVEEEWGKAELHGVMAPDVFNT
ncbi:hypothetical protein KVP10_01285 [Candidimonas humi]|uniref:Uncharacterized protein n=1 Tax=Candidimonas humi TaxID=683355 RepID=A0ABV8NUV5_9BURK|nr:hypothetical protein [Candidimonas humi]MBV6303495.1 hypothetical protein [Candidimonas humi]